MFERQRILVEQGRIPYGPHIGKYVDRLEETTFLNICRNLSQSKIDRLIFKNFGPLYEKILEEQKRKKENELRLRQGEHFGEIGQKVKNLELTVGFTFWIKKTGVSLISLKDSQGRKFVMFYKGSESFRKGKVVKLNGVVTKHQEYNGEKQTLLSKIEKVG